MSQSIYTDLPYNPISKFYKERFGEKVHKISVAVAETCPNREGLKGMQTCNFCDQWGSAAYAKNLEKPLTEQITSVRNILKEKRKANKFLIYFQAYTTTFKRASHLKDQFLQALQFPDVVGLVIGTRPDCLSPTFLEICDELSQKTFVSVEMGVQSLDNRTLAWMRRGHTAEQSVRGLQLLAEKAPRVNLGAHLIFGAPNETDADVVQFAQTLNELPIHNVKLHHLHVLKNTPLEEEFRAGDFVPLEREAYFQRCSVFLQNLRPDLAVHRLSAFAPRWDELVAPAWTSFKMETYQGMLQFMRDHGTYQGQLYRAKVKPL